MATLSGTEFLVNTTTLNEQSLSDITGLTNGRFVVTWQDLSQTAPDTAGYATRAQIFNADGSQFGAEFVVNTTTTSFQLEGRVSGLMGGGFVATWTDFNPGGGDTSGGAAIRGQIFDAAGTKVGGEFLVNTTTLNGQTESAVTTLKDGRFVVSWTDQSDISGFFPTADIRAQIFTANGTKSGTEFIVNSQRDENQYNSEITALKNGGFVVTWTDGQPRLDDASVTAVRMQVYSAGGFAVGGETLVNSTTLGQQLQSRVTALENGRFVVSWTDISLTGGDTSVDSVRARIFTAAGVPVGSEFVVNTTTSLSQNQSTIVALPDGRFVVAWRDFSATGADTSGPAIRAQVFNANGNPAGAEFVVNTTVLGFQFDPAITALADGRFVVSWTDFSQTFGDVSGFAIRAQIFDARTAAISLNGTAQGDDYLGTKFADDLNGAGGGDRLSGAQGHDTLTGGAGADTLIGGAGADLLHGGPGKDLLTGGGGADRFIFASAAEAGFGGSRDRISDFGNGADKIDLSGFMAGGQFVGSGPFGAAGDVRFDAGSAILSGDVDGDGLADFEIKLSGVGPTAGDFIF